MMSLHKIILGLGLIVLCAAPVEAGQNVTEAPPQLPEQLQMLTIVDAPQNLTNTPALDLVQEGQIAILPYMDWYLDEKGTYNVDSMSNDMQKSSFTKYNVLDFSTKQGLSWFRIEVLPVSEGNTHENYLDLGKVQGKEKVWVKKNNERPLSLTKTADGLYPLEDLQGGGTLYVAVEGVTDLWFTPALRTEGEKTSAPENKYQPLLLAALAILTLLCLLRSLLDKGEWRFWAGLFGLAALGTQIFGVPATPRGQLIASDLLPVFSVAIALFLLPNVGRQLMNTQEKAKVADFTLLLFAVLGAMLSILPLVPSFAWLARYANAWEFLAIFPLVITLLLVFKGVGRSAVYFLWLLLILGGIITGLLGIGGTLDTPLWSMAPLLGLVLAMLVLALCPGKKAYEAPEDIRSKKKNGTKNTRVMSSSTKAANLTIGAPYEESVGMPMNIEPRNAGSVEKPATLTAAPLNPMQIAKEREKHRKKILSK